MYNTMKRLIEAKYYKTKEEAIEILDTFFAMQKLTLEEYVELTMLADEMYDIRTPMTPLEPSTEPTEPIE